MKEQVRDVLLGFDLAVAGASSIGICSGVIRNPLDRIVWTMVPPRGDDNEYAELINRIWYEKACAMSAG